MPKAELHLHLDGSLRIETALELAATRGVDAPRDWAGHVAPRSSRRCRARHQAELLRAFDLPIALMQDAEALERITAELVETKAAEGVRYVEIRWGPLLHVAARAVPRGRHRRGLCAAPRTRPPGPGTVVRLICTALRSHDPAANVELAETAARVPRPRPHRLGPGRPRGGVPGPAAPRPRLRGRPRRAACGSPLHAGEWGGAAQVRRALAIDPERIAHGSGGRRRPGAVRGADRPRRDPRPVPDLELAGRDRAVASPSIRSPGSTGLGVPVTLSTDDTTVSDITLSEEYANAVEPRSG